MLPKKRILVGAVGATVALTLQTPVSAFIAKVRRGPVATAASHHPPSYLADAFTEAGERLLGSDRWKGWRSDAGGSLADDLDAAPRSGDLRVASTLGDVDLDSVSAAALSGGCARAPLGRTPAGRAEAGRSGRFIPVAAVAMPGICHSRH